MKKYRTKPWAKGLACGLFVLAMTVSVICLGNVRWLAYHGGYQWEGTRQLVEEEEAVWVENLTNQLADGYRSYRDGDQSLDVKRYVEDENFFFTIKDLEGNTLLASDTLGDYREKTSWSMQVGARSNGVILTSITTPMRPGTLPWTSWAAHMRSFKMCLW